MKFLINSCILFSLAVLITSCENDPSPTPKTPTPVYGMFKLEFEHSFGDRDFDFDSVYTNGHGQSMQFTRLNYYVSNVTLTKTDGSTWSEPESYHLVKLSSPESTLLSISNVPAGDYSAYSFAIGVDSARNVSGAQTGALDPINEMFWSWNSGYKFIVAEGTAPDSPMMGGFEYHIGGFRDANGTNALQTFSHSFNGQSMSIRPTTAPQIHTHIDFATFFNGAELNLNVATTPMVHMPGDTAVRLAKNFKEAIEFEHFHQ